MKVKSILSVVIALAFSTIAVASCSGEVDSDNEQEASTFGDSDCASCLSTSCSAERATCDADPDCSNYLGCLYGCPVAADGNADPSCAAGCALPSNSVGEQAQLALNACHTSGAGASCEACGSNSGCGTHPVIDQCCDLPAEGDDACDLCKNEHCCETRATLNANAEAVAYNDCVVACHGSQSSTYACFIECEEDHSAGIQDFGPQYGCVLSRCSEPCDGPPPDACSLCVFINDCAEEFANVHADPAGFLLSACIGLCDPVTQDCINSCTAQYPGGVDLWNVFNQCTNSKCFPVCG